jgi:hypothetical protein
MELSTRNPYHPYCIKVSLVDGSADVRIFVKHARSTSEWVLDISDSSTYVRLHPDLETADHVVTFLNGALEKEDGTSIKLEQKGENLNFVVVRQTKFGTRETTLELPRLPISEERLLEKRLDVVQEKIEQLHLGEYHGDFAFHPDCHNTLVLFHNNTAVRKKGTGATGPHAAVRSVRKYNDEIVYWEFRVVCAGTRAVIMIGAAQTDALDTYAGATATGSSLYLYSVNMYTAGSNTDYPLQPKSVKSGSYVGMLLDTKAYTIKFSINGEFGPEHKLTGPHGDGYYVRCSLHDGEECLEILPAFCKHLSQ